MTGRASDMSGINELGFGIGDIVTWDDGCTMILPTFARIISATRCTAQAEVLRNRTVACEGYSNYVVPSEPTGEIVTLRSHQEGLCKQGRYGSLVYHWDGEPEQHNDLD